MYGEEESEDTTYQPSDSSTTDSLEYYSSEEIWSTKFFCLIRVNPQEKK